MSIANPTSNFVLHLRGDGARDPAYGRVHLCAICGNPPRRRQIFAIFSKCSVYDDFPIGQSGAAVQTGEILFHRWIRFLAAHWSVREKWQEASSVCCGWVSQFWEY